MTNIGIVCETQYTLLRHKSKIAHVWLDVTTMHRLKVASGPVQNVFISQDLQILFAEEDSSLSADSRRK